MDPSALPSTYRKSSPEQSEQEPTIWENDKNQGKGGISPTMLAMSSQCLLRAVWKARGEKGVGPSPFTQSVMADGNEYEKRMMDIEGRKIWIKAINQAFELDLPEDMPQLKYPAITKGKNCTTITKGKDETPEAFVHRATQTLQAALPTTPSAPFFLHEPRLASIEDGALLQGLPDLMIWTGKGKKWIIADLKCSEEAKRAHGIQVAAYARMFQAMRPQKKNTHPTGVIIHCAPGYRYTATSNENDKKLTLNHSQATPFPLESLAGAVGEAVEVLANPNEDTLNRALDAAVFSAVCVECGFRFRCYPRFLQQRHVSLVPLQKAELEAVMATGIRTIEDLIAAIDDPKSPAYESLLELKDGSPLQLGYLRQKAKRICEKGLYSKWRVSPEEPKTPLFFTAVEKEGLFSPGLDVFTKYSKPTCLVVYSERERRMAWAKIIAANKKDECSGIHTFILSEIVQQNVHGPLPSITLRPLADMLTSHSNYDGFLTRYPESSANDIPSMEKAIQDSSTAAARMKHLQIVWDFLKSAAIPFSLPEAL